MLKTHGIRMNTCIFFKPLWLLDSSVNEDYAHKKVLFCYHGFLYDVYLIVLPEQNTSRFYCWMLNNLS